MGRKKKISEVVEEAIVKEKGKIMSTNEIMLMINECIKSEVWLTTEAQASGIEIDIFPEWKGQMEQIVWSYKKAGWMVWHYLHGDREFLHFKDPSRFRFPVDFNSLSSIKK